MRFVIVGAGRVGIRTARALRESGHEVVMIELDDVQAREAEREGFEVVRGDGSKEAILEQAGIEQAEAFGALTSDLNDNFAACLIAKNHGARTVLRIDEDYREDIYRKYATAIDEVIYPERLGAIAAKNALLGGSSRAIADVAGNLQLVEFTVTETAPIRGYTLTELELPANSRLLAFGKRGDPVDLPGDDVSLETGDQIVVLSAFDVLGDVRQLIVGDPGQIARGGA